MAAFDHTAVMPGLSLVACAFLREDDGFNHDARIWLHDECAGMATVDHGKRTSKRRPKLALSGGAAVLIWIESMRRKNDIKGMSLLELVIVLAIVALLSAYAIPAYQSYIRRGHRSAVCTALYRAAQAVEQMLAERSATGERMKLPSSLNQSPPDTKAVYRLRLQVRNPNNGHYTIEADPVETGPMRDDGCGSYVLDANGQRSNRINGELSVDRVAQCWEGK